MGIILGIIAIAAFFIFGVTFSGTNTLNDESDFESSFKEKEFTDYRLGASDHNWEADGDVRWDDIGPYAQ